MLPNKLSLSLYDLVTQQVGHRKIQLEQEK